MDNNFVTIVGIHNYLGFKPFKVGRIVKLVKEPDNDYDEDAIKVELPFIDTIGYVANSSHTVFAGTNSASRLYDKIGESAYAKVMIITHSSVIAQVVSVDDVKNSENIDPVFMGMISEDKETTAK